MASDLLEEALALIGFQNWVIIPKKFKASSFSLNEIVVFF